MLIVLPMKSIWGVSGGSTGLDKSLIAVAEGLKTWQGWKVLQVCDQCYAIWNVEFDELKALWGQQFIITLSRVYYI